ncbi:outer membrane lipoprotein SlyB [Paraburkholderia sp. UCT70]
MVRFFYPPDPFRTLVGHFDACSGISIGNPIRTALIATTLVFATAGTANAAGCIKGAVVGGVAGHYAGHHAVVGAVGGCMVGRHLAKQHAQQQAAQSQAAQAQ